MIFINNKYTKVYYQIVDRARIRVTDEHTENHHIIPDCFFINRKRKGKPGWLEGNPEAKDNKVRLTGQEHFICHWLLIKMVDGPGQISMVHALWNMRAKNKNHKRYNGHITGKMYARLKEAKAAAMSVLMKGRVRSAETVSKWRKSHAWYKASEETNQRISDTMTGVKKAPFSEEHRKNIGLAGIGRVPWNKGSSCVMPIPWNKGTKGAVVRTEESKANQARIQTGRSWWNNGTNQTLSKICPEGWVLGRLPNKKNR